MQFSIKYNDPNAPLTIMESSKNLDAFNFSPNPVSDELTVKIKATKNDKSILNIYNGIGAITIKKEIYLTEGENIFQINTKRLRYLSQHLLQLYNFEKSQTHVNKFFRLIVPLKSVRSLQILQKVSVVLLTLPTPFLHRC